MTARDLLLKLPAYLTAGPQLCTAQSPRFARSKRLPPGRKKGGTPDYLRPHCRLARGANAQALARLGQALGAFSVGRASHQHVGPIRITSPRAIQFQPCHVDTMLRPQVSNTEYGSW